MRSGVAKNFRCTSQSSLMQPSPPFNDAVSTLRDFLRSQDVSDNLRWIWRDSIISRRGIGSRYLATRPIYIDQSLLAAESDIRDYYQTGVDRDLGIRLAVFCIADGHPYCYIELPEDEAHASNMMISSLKCSLPDPPPVATIVRSAFFAKCMRLFMRMPQSSWANQVPLKPSA